MQLIKNMAPEGTIIVAIILSLFVLAVILLFSVCIRYRLLRRDLARKSNSGRSAFAEELVAQYSAAYRQFGSDTNSPAIINNVLSDCLGGTLFCERFMNNAVSLFVTLGLFGTFLGLTLSVSSLSELLSAANSSEWLNILDSVGSGLFSSLSGMGVAFYTSLVGVACSILFTVLRAIFNPQALREQLETSAELWLDHEIGPKLATEFPHDDTARLITLKKELRMHAAAIERSLNACTESLQQALNGASDSMNEMIENSREPLAAFYDTVQTFNDNVRDFSTINYDLRGSVERMDLAARDLSGALIQAGASVGGRNDK